MQRILEGVRHFQTVGFTRHQPLFERLAHGQEPLACFITCADSRINPNLITNTEPGELFIVRNVGNIVPPHGAESQGEAAAVEFAISALNVPDIIVCGHSNCGALKGLLGLSGSLAKMPAVVNWLEHAEATRRIISENYPGVAGETLVSLAAEINVLVQIEHLRTLPAVASRLNRGNLKLHAWVYQIETGEVLAYDSEHRRFLPILETMRPSESVSSGSHLAKGGAR